MEKTRPDGLREDVALTPQGGQWNWEVYQYSSSLAETVNHFGAWFSSGLDGNESRVSGGGKGNGTLAS